MHRESGSILATPGVATLHIAYFSSSFNSRIIEAKSPGNGFSARVPHFLATARFFSTNFALQGLAYPSAIILFRLVSFVFFVDLSSSFYASLDLVFVESLARAYRDRLLTSTLPSVEQPISLTAAEIVARGKIIAILGGN